MAKMAASKVPLSAMLDDRFALSDLEGKSANIDTELTSTTIHDDSILKKITGRQPYIWGCVNLNDDRLLMRIP
jgi:hypothetical protein